MRKWTVGVALSAMAAIPAPGMAQTTTAQISGAEVQNFCIFDGSVYSAGSTICSSTGGVGRALTCHAKGTKATPAATPANYAVATWTSVEDERCAQK